LGTLGLKSTFRILLVEDNRGDVDLILEALKPFGNAIELKVAQDGDEAMSALTGKSRVPPALRPDLILLDLNLPKKDGREVLAEIKGTADLRSIPVCVLTSSEAHDDIKNAYALGANCYVTKPFSLDNFLFRIKHVIEFWMSHATLAPHPD
jgi:two-component system, chemotaxis family, response regulator Rcp1